MRKGRVYLFIWHISVYRLSAPTVRKGFGRVGPLLNVGSPPVAGDRTKLSVGELAAKLALDKSATSRRLRDATDRGHLVNL
jgi:hypothetical protein